MAITYTLTESQFNALSSINGQLRLLAGLLIGGDQGGRFIDADGMEDFITAQHEALSEVLSSSEQLYEVERETRQHQEAAAPRKPATRKRERLASPTATTAQQ